MSNGTFLTRRSIDKPDEPALFPDLLVTGGSATQLEPAVRRTGRSQLEGLRIPLTPAQSKRPA